MTDSWSGFGRHPCRSDRSLATGVAGCCWKAGTRTIAPMSRCVRYTRTWTRLGSPGWERQSDDGPFYYRVHSPMVMIEFDHHPGVVFEEIDQGADRFVVNPARAEPSEAVNHPCLFATTIPNRLTRRSRRKFDTCGDVAEFSCSRRPHRSERCRSWSNGPDSKSGVSLRAPRVRIPASPPHITYKLLKNNIKKCPLFNGYHFTYHNREAAFAAR